MKHVQWLTISAERDSDDPIRFSINGVKAEQEYIIDSSFMNERTSVVRVGTLVEPSLKMALRDVRDAVRQEIIHPFIEWLDGILPTKEDER